MTFQRTLMLAGGAALLAASAHALDLKPGGAFIEAGAAGHGTYSVTAGVTWPWAWRHEGLGGEQTGYTEAYLSHWSSRTLGGRASLTQLGLLPMVRHRFARGSSDWFAEAGIGLSLTDRFYTTDEKRFSTRFNFVDVVGVGRSFGPGRRQEMTLRLSHVSNAGIKKPNPGENFLQLRYAASF